MKCNFNIIFRLVGSPPFYSENLNEMYNQIIKSPIHFPHFISKEAKSLISGLLEKDPKKRLGSERDYFDIQEHEFFKDIDWDKLYKKKIK